MVTTNDTDTGFPLIESDLHFENLSLKDQTW